MGETATTGPTIHTVVEKDRIDALVREMRTYLMNTTKTLGEKLELDTRRALQQAYRLGVIDGFQQGALAADAHTGEAS